MQLPYKLIRKLLMITTIMFIASSNVYAESEVPTNSNYKKGMIPSEKYDDILIDGDGKYYMEFSDSDSMVTDSLAKNSNYVLETGIYELDIYSEEDVNELLYYPGISTEMKEDILKLFEDSKNDIEKDSEITIFSPIFLETKSSQITYKTFLGKRMKNERIYISRSTNMYEVSKGTKPGSSIANMFWLITNLAPGPIQIFPNGVSIYQYFINNFGVPTYGGSSNSRLEAGLVYNTYLQYTYSETYSNSNQWLLGLVSQQTTLIKIDLRLHLYIGGNMSTKLGSSIKNYTTSTKNYGNPWSTAYYNYSSPTTEEVRFKIGNVEFNGR